MEPGASGAPTAVVISRFSSPRTQGIQQLPTTTNTVTTTIPATSTDWIKPFHLPNRFSNHPVKGSLMPEFSANSNLRDCNPASTLATDPSGALLLGIKVQHVVTSSHRPLHALPITYLYLYSPLTLSVEKITNSC
jgi:hypothetical protein